MTSIEHFTAYIQQFGQPDEALADAEAWSVSEYDSTLIGMNWRNGFM